MVQEDEVEELAGVLMKKAEAWMKQNKIIYDPEFES